jgi:hypothetical protein
MITAEVQEQALTHKPTQCSACVMFAHIPETKANHMAELRLWQDNTSNQQWEATTKVQSKEH